MKNLRLVRRYTEAFIDSIKVDEFEAIRSEFQQLITALDEELMKFLTSAIVDQPKKLSFINTLARRINLREELHQLLVVLSNRNRMNLIFDIYDLFVEKMNASLNLAVVQVETKYPLTQELKESVKHELEKRFQTHIVINEKINPQLLAGILIKRGDVVIDFTLNSKLKNLRQHLHEIMK